MANFQAAFDKTMGHEGLYSTDPQDAGGETYRGISRRYHPRWSGWRIIDALRWDEDFPACLARLQALQETVLAFYQQEFWDRLLGDQQPNQAIAEELFDTAVNMDVADAVKFLQRSLNALNRSYLGPQALYPDLVVDGKIGPTTLRALTTYLQSDPPQYLLIALNVCQGAHYLNVMGQSPTQEKYARGWFNRVTLEKA